MGQTELFKIAKQHHKRHGFNLIPASRQKKAPLARWKDNSYNFMKDFQKHETSDCNLGLLVSEDMIIVDIDNKPPAIPKGAPIDLYSTNTGVSDFAQIASLQEELPQTLAVSTPSGGQHLYFKLRNTQQRKQLKNWSCCMSNDDILMAVDIRVSGGFLVIPPSVKEIGKVYKWKDGDGSTPIATVPDWIIENIVKTKGTRPVHFERQAFTCTNEPHFNDDITEAHLEILKASEWWQTCFQVKGVNHNNIIDIQATKPYDCKICSRRHEKNNFQPFLVNNESGLRFVCRPVKGCSRPVQKQYSDVVKKAAVFISECTESDAAHFYQMLRPNEVKGNYTDGLMITLNHNNTWIVDSDIKKTSCGLRLSNVIKEFMKDNEDELLELIENGTKKMKSFRYKLGSSHFLTGVTWFLPQMSENHCPDVVKLLLQNSHLLAFSDGVYDLTKGVFRKGILPEDYVVLTTGYPFPASKTSKHEEAAKVIKKFFSDIFAGNQEVIDFRLQLIANSLSGRRFPEIFTVSKGITRNGKGVEAVLQAATMGQYYGTIPISAFTGAEVENGKADPAWAMVFLKRAVASTEPGRKDKINGRIVKDTAGQELKFARKLNKDGFRFPVIGLLFFQTNEDLRFDTYDPAVMGKLYAFEYPYSFLLPDEYRKDNPSHRPADPHIKHNFATDPIIREAFMQMLLEVYAEMQKVHWVFKVPSIIKDYTAQETSINIQIAGWFHANYEIRVATPMSVKRTDVWETCERENPTLAASIGRNSFYKELEEGLKAKPKEDSHRITYYTNIVRKGDSRKTADGNVPVGR